MSKQPPATRTARPATSTTGRPGTPATRSAGSSRPRPTARRARQPWWRGPIALVAVVILVVVVVVVFIVVGNQQSSPGSAQIGKPALASDVAKVTSVPASVIAAVGKGSVPGTTGALPNLFQKTSGPALTLNGKPEVLYIGGEFCPICAVERWSLINALSRFGTFTNLSYMRSAVDDGNLATFTFLKSSYSSPYISFVPVETEDRNHNTLTPMTTAQSQLLSTLGSNSFPFIDIGGSYYQSGAYGDTVLSGKSWSQIGDALTNPKDPVTQVVIGNANYITSTVCKVTHDTPASVCNTPTIKSLG